MKTVRYKLRIALEVKMKVLDSMHLKFDLRSAMASALLALLAVSAIAVHAARQAAARSSAARPPVVSNSSITISGQGTGGTRTIALPFMNNFENKGDWYVTLTDAHAAFFLADAQATKEGRIDLVLNGKQKTFVINQDNNKDTGHKTDQLFGVMVGSAQKSTMYRIEKDDAVTVTVAKVDPLTFEATFSGTVTHDAERLKVNGVISLHRPTAPPDKTAGTYVNCDPLIHDWLNQAQDRAPSECEVKFDEHVRTDLNKAFAPMVSAFEGQQWRLTKTPNLGPLLSMPRGAEKTSYTSGLFTLGLVMSSSDPEYQRLKAAADAPDPGMMKVMELMKQGKYAEAQAAQKELKPNNAFADFKLNTQIDVSASVNTPGINALNFHGAFDATPLPGGGTVIYLPAAQPPTGGAEGEIVTMVLLGQWGQASVAKGEEDTTRVSIKAAMNPSAARLSTQTVVLTFRCSRELAKKAIQTIDWSALRTLIAGN
jgi:hypothetical protein